MNRIHKKIYYRSTVLFLASCFLLFGLAGCKKLIDVDPPSTTVNQGNVYNSDATAVAAMTSIYANMSNLAASSNVMTGSGSISVLAGLSADELTLDGIASGNLKLNAYYTNNLVSNASQNYGSEFWGGSSFYYFIFLANSVIEGLQQSTGLTPAVKNQLLGEAKFVRAFCHFYLVNFFGDIPLVLSTDQKINSTVSRIPKDQVFHQIVGDLKQAQSLLSSNFVSSDAASATTERIRPNKWTATALLARTYLYTNQYDSAEVYASQVISNTALYDTVSLNNVFLKNSKEAIWQLQPTRLNRNTEDAFVFIITSTGPSTSKPVYLSSYLLSQFEAGDKRRFGRNWIDSVKVSGNTYYFPYKYKATTASSGVTEFLMVMRLAELYLIRAEARAKMNNLSGAISDLDVIRKRAQLQLIAISNPGISQSALISAILHERQIELFTEFGHRWLDLKRTGTVNTVMQAVTPAKGGNWTADDQLYPIPFYDLDKNSNLKQNPGY
jgi:hypothetical protein